MVIPQQKNECCRQVENRIIKPGRGLLLKTLFPAIADHYT